MSRLDRWRKGLVRCSGVLAVAGALIGVPPATATMISTIHVGANPEGLASDGVHVWVSNRGDDTVSEIDPSSGAVVNTIAVGREPKAVSSDGTHVWVANRGDGTVSEIQVSSGTVLSTIPVGGELDGVSADGTHVWVTSGAKLVEIDASTASVVNTIPLEFGHGGVSSDGIHVWAAYEQEVSEVDASTGAVVRTVKVGYGTSGVSSDGTHVWVANSEDFSVSEIDASSGVVVRTIKVGNNPSGISSDGGHVWVANTGDPLEGTVSEIEASSGAAIHGIHFGREPQGISSDGTDVWVTHRSEGTVSEIPTSYAPECTANSGQISLSPGLRATAAVQTMKIQGTMSGCAYEPFTATSYVATLRTAGPVSCSVLTAGSETASGAAKFKWTPKAKPSTGVVTLPLSQTPSVAFSGEVTKGFYVPLMFAGTATESYMGASGCGGKPIKKGAFSGSAVSLLF